MSSKVKRDKRRRPLIPDVIRPGSRPKHGYDPQGTKLGPRRPPGGYQPDDGRLSTIRKLARRAGR
jgi:hypothetical protein